jgi:C4-dicarboxylate-specific signal transduction histidine kinase
VVIDKTVPDISPRLRIAIEKACQTNKLPPKNIFIGDYIFRIASVPLTDFSKKNVGNLLAVYDITEKIRALKITLLKTFCAILFVISVLFVFFYRYSGRIEKQLLSFHNQLENIVKYRTRELQQALDEVKTLRGFLPICSYCKKIRDDKGYWNQIEAYISEHSEVQFSHGICTECMKKHYPEIHVKESASEK